MSATPLPFRWTFDDEHLGHSTNGGRTLTQRVVARPEGLTGSDWYRFAGGLVDHLNQPTLAVDEVASEQAVAPKPRTPAP